MSSVDVIDRLAAHRTLGTAPREELAWLAAHGHARSLAVGELLSSVQRPVEGLHIVLSGLITIHVDRGLGQRRVMEWRSGDVTGVLPYSRLQKPPGDAVVEEPAEVFTVPRDLLPDLVRQCYHVTAILVHVMTDRARTFTVSDFHDEKMASLGRLAAGLAHELNNPTSAAARSAKRLVKALDDAEAAQRILMQAHLSDRQLADVAALRECCVGITTFPPNLARSAVDTADREDAITGWLEARGVNDSTGIAATLAGTPVRMDALDRLAASFAGEQLAAALTWTAGGCSARALATDVESATTRIHDLVGAVKSFTYMDRGSIPEETDISRGLADTATVLEGKAHQRRVTLHVNAPGSLPRIYAVAGELNQIWEKLIDNAIDAAAPDGHVQITAANRDRALVVSIVDDGPGIPTEVVPRIYDPFFTTKPPGQGTGLGLTVARRLVSWHSGEINVSSKPGRTEFEVTLPIRSRPT